MLKDKVAVVTGGGRGIGRAITLAYAREGADLVLAARSIEALTETKAAVESLGRKALVVPTDVLHEESVHNLAEQALSHFGRVDVLVNNSGIGGPTAPLWEITPADWQETFAVNVTGVYLCCRALLPGFRQGNFDNRRRPERLRWHGDVLIERTCTLMEANLCPGSLTSRKKFTRECMSTQDI